MQRILTQGIAIVILFAGTFVLLNQVDWMSMLNVKSNTRKTEEKLGELFWDVIRKSEKEKTDEFILNSLDSLLSDLCSKNGINRKSVKFHVIEKDEVNAFALPGRHLVLYTGLIAASENPDEVAGVLGHELAHIELNHVMKKLVKELGLATLISITTGDNPQLITETVRMLSSTAFDRSLEKEADIKSVDYMVAADLDPEHFANFLYKMSVSETGTPGFVSWISTHPESEERAKYVVEYSSDKSVTSRKIISEKTWLEVKEKLTNP